MCCKSNIYIVCAMHSKEIEPDYTEFIIHIECVTETEHGDWHTKLKPETTEHHVI